MKEKREKRKTKKKKRIWVRILLLILALAVVVLGARALDAVADDPNLLLKKISTEVTEDKSAEVQYRYKAGKEGLFSKDRIPLFSFTPEKSGEYTFSVSDVVSADDVFLSLQVSDSHFNNYLTIDNTESDDGSFSGTVFLNAGSTCYIPIDAFSETDIEEYSGSFSFKVSKAAEEERPVKITESEPAVIKLSENIQTAVLFVPEETGYFRFESTIISKDRSASSDISSVKTTDNKEIKRAEGICQLEGGKEYFVWVSAQDMSVQTVQAVVSCMRLESVMADRAGEYKISGDAIIEFKAKETKNLAVYSVSDGNVRCSVYDSKGFPLNSDEGSGGELSGNDGDFALVIQAQKKNQYIIYTEGQYDECTIVITEYTGDGSSFGKDDVAAVKTEEQENDGAGQEGDEAGQENKEAGDEPQ